MERCYGDTQVPNVSKIWHVEMKDVCLFSEKALAACNKHPCLHMNALFFNEVTKGHLALLV